jgi:hypothetical protein
MMFREIHEIREEKVNNKKQEDYLNIKPKTNMTSEEVESFWAEEFRKLSEAED